MQETRQHQISALFVEDNKPIRLLFEKRLAPKVQNLYVAEDGKEGFEVFRKFWPDLVITDVSMPVMNGLEMIRRIKEISPNVSVIVMSAYSNKEYFTEAIDLGVKGYLLKPIEWDKLDALIDELAGNILSARMLGEKELEREMAESNLKKSLAEKELLLREVHHRVKNNMQIITSILRMQERLIDDPMLKSALGESQNRIHSIALIHENLYHNDSLANINFSNYVRSLAGNLSRSYGDQQGRIRFDYHLDQNVDLPVEIGIPVGLIINELISNSFKHAFKGRDHGKITLALTVENGGRYRLIVADDGIGLDDPDLLWRSGSLGMRIAEKLIQQIGGSIETDFSGGTKYIIMF